MSFDAATDRTSKGRTTPMLMYNRFRQPQGGPLSPWPANPCPPPAANRPAATALPAPPTDDSRPRRYRAAPRAHFPRWPSHKSAPSTFSASDPCCATSESSGRRGAPHPLSPPSPPLFGPRCPRKRNERRHRRRIDIHIEEQRKARRRRRIAAALVMSWASSTPFNCIGGVCERLIEFRASTFSPHPAASNPAQA